jgi:hypothetical protein
LSVCDHTFNIAEHPIGTLAPTTMGAQLRTRQDSNLLLLAGLLLLYC